MRWLNQGEKKKKESLKQNESGLVKVKESLESLNLIKSKLKEVSSRVEVVRAHTPTATPSVSSAPRRQTNFEGTPSSVEILGKSK